MASDSIIGNLTRVHGMAVSGRELGISLLETAAAVTLCSVLFVSLFTLAAQSLQFLEAGDVQTAVQNDASHAYSRLIEVLRKSGRVERGGVEYPRVRNAGRELEFLLPIDADGNGYAFDQTTGAVEWDPRVFRVRRDNSASFDLYADGSKVLALGQDVFNPRFETVLENSALGLNEVTVFFEVRKATRDGIDHTASVSASVRLRN